MILKENEHLLAFQTSQHKAPFKKKTGPKPPLLGIVSHLNGLQLQQSKDEKNERNDTNCT
jgi:hypothetical protein